MDHLLRPLKMIADLLLGQLGQVLFSVGSMFSAASLASAMAIALAILAWARRSRRRAVRVRTLLRALFPRWLVRSPSSRADLGLTLLNTFPAVILLAGMMLSATQVSQFSAAALGRLLGAAPHQAFSPAVCRAIATFVLFLAYEFAYWLDHVLSHRVPMLWAFHKVHHTAEVLTPLTVFRVHPVDTLVFANITAVVVGLTGGGLHYLFGASGSPVMLSGANVILVGFVFLTIHLQHSHIWISFTGLAGRIFLSPAHHQIHHSSNPIHFNRNFGSCLSIWDWVFGTLHVPAARREALRFGAELHSGAASPHSVTGTMLSPFEDAWRALPAPRRRSPTRRLGANGPA